MGVILKSFPTWFLNATDASILFGIFTLFVKGLQRTLSALRSSVVPPHTTPVYSHCCVPSLPCGLWFSCQKVIKLSHISVGKKHHRKDCKVFRNSKNSFINLKKCLSSSWVPGLVSALRSWGEQNQTGCCLVEETQMITKKWNDNYDSQPETTWSTSDPDRHSGKEPLRRSCSSWDQIQKVLTGVCVCVCVCVWERENLSGDHVQAEIRYKMC